MTWLPFIDGLMPVQFFVELAGLIFILSGLSVILNRTGMPVNRFWKAVGLFVCIFLYLKYRVYPPIPFSVLATYLVVTLAAILLWASSSEEYWQEFRQSIIATLDAGTQATNIIRAGFAVFLPILAWYLTWDSMLIKIKINEPVELRTVYAAIPREALVHGKMFDVESNHNPFRVDDSGHHSTEIGKKYVTAIPFGESLPPYLVAVREGGDIYFNECVLCHGANLSGGGLYASAYNPHPISFTSLFQVLRPGHSDFFVRTAKGGMWLPPEAFPWLSTMPPMEEHLSMDDIWKVNLFTYWHTGIDPYWEN
jgi:hypothetical protein